MTANGQDERKRLSVGLLDDGVQADGIGSEEMAGAERLAVVSQGDRWGAVCRWGGANQRRLTQPSATTFDNSSDSGFTLFQTRFWLVLMGFEWISFPAFTEKQSLTCLCQWKNKAFFCDLCTKIHRNKCKTLVRVHSRR